MLTDPTYPWEYSFSQHLLAVGQRHNSAPYDTAHVYQIIIKSYTYVKHELYWRMYYPFQLSVQLLELKISMNQKFDVIRVKF